MTDYLVDQSAWTRYFLGDNAVVSRLREIEQSPSDLLVTCAPQVLEFCHSARNPAEHRARRDWISQGFPLEHPPGEALVLEIQGALWDSGKVRAAGALDVLIAGYAILNGATVLTADRDFEHIAAVSDLDVEYIAPTA